MVAQPHRQIATLAPSITSIPQSRSTIAERQRQQIDAMNQDQSCDDADSMISTEQYIALLRAMIKFLPHHPDRASQFYKLAATLRQRYEETDTPEDLEDAINLHREALRLQRPAHQDRPGYLADLAFALRTRYSKHGMEKDLEEGVALYREALQLLAQGDPERARLLNNLANSLHARYEYSGILTDLEEAIALHRESLRLRPQTHTDRSMSIGNLATSLQTRYENLGTLNDLEEAIGLHREGLELRPNGHPDRSSSLSNLAGLLRIRYGGSGLLHNLEEAIALHREAVKLRPQGHPLRPKSLNNLANSVQTRYEFFGTSEDLLEAIELYRETLQLHPQGHFERSVFLSNLAVSLQFLHKKSGTLKDLEESITLSREALELRPHGHPDRSLSLSNLAKSLQTRYRRSGVSKDLEDAVRLQREALQLRPQLHPDRSSSLIHLASSLRTRFIKWGTSKDLEEAITLLQEALRLQPHGHPNKATSLHHLARSMTLICGTDLVSGTVVSETQRFALEAVNYSYTNADARMRFALYWANDTNQDMTFRLQMHRNSLLLLQQVLVINPGLAQQQSNLSKLSQHVSAASAAAIAIQTGDVMEAIALLDLGRSVFLSTLQRYRTPLDDLRALNASLADELQAVGSQLENLAMLHNYPAGLSKHVTALDHVLNTQRELIRQWDNIILRIRRLHSLEDFLGMSSYAKLQTAAIHGPIIFLNASVERCDAIIMTSTGMPSLVPLSKTSWEHLKELAELLETSRSSNNPNKRRMDLVLVLRSLWDVVVSPVIEKLVSLGFKPQHRNRIWWCPTSWFTMLPIHAAGLYDGPKSPALLDLFVASYISTATSLLRSMENKTIADSSPARPILFVGHTDNDDLEGVDIELESLLQIQSIETTSLLNASATPNTVLEEMKRHSWVHLSCHGWVEHNTPLGSHFTLEGGNLHVQDIMRVNLQNAEFAFLSACNSAAGSRIMLDENLHLTSALQFAGFRSVVGTMWEMYDSDASSLTKDFYFAMGKLGGRYCNAARALHYALKQFRQRAEVERWAMFIHVGA